MWKIKITNGKTEQEWLINNNSTKYVHLSVEFHLCSDGNQQFSCTECKSESCECGRLSLLGLRYRMETLSWAGLNIFPHTYYCLFL